MNPRRVFLLTTAYVCMTLELMSASQARGTESAPQVDVPHAIAAIFNGLGAYHKALGLEAESERDARSAQCIVRSKCSLDEALDSMEKSAASVRAETADRQADDNRLGTTFAVPAANALVPAVEALGKLAQTSRSLPRNLRRVAPKLQGSLKITGAAFRAAIDYLSFSGVATTELSVDLEAALKGS